MCSLTMKAFDLADKYLTPVYVVADGYIGQMMEPVEFAMEREAIKELPAKHWAATGNDGSKPRSVINSLFLDPEELEHVFDRFYRGTRRREERAGGSGLGLAIARSIVDMHHGRVAISSTPGEGTEVIVTLPADVSQSSSSDARA